MSSPELTLFGETHGLVTTLSVGRRPTPLSQGVIAGVVRGLDLIAVVAAGLAMQLLRLDALSAEYVTAILLYTLLILLGGQSAGIYRFTAIMQPGKVAGKLLLVCVLGFLVLVGIAFALKVSHEYSRLWAFTWVLGAFTFAMIVRAVVASMLTALSVAGRIGRCIVVYGGGVQGQQLIKRINQLNEPWNRIVGVFDDRLARTESSVEGYPLLGNLVDLVSWGRSNRPDEILVALPWGAEQRVVHVLRRLAVLPANVRLSPEFLRTDMIQGRTNYQFGIPMLSACEKPVDGWGRIWKRLFDLGLSAAVVAATLPLLLLIAAAIRLEGPGPVVFRQKRFGFNNKIIEVYKFRTMHTSHTDELGVRLTERNDPRVTKVGTVLRRLSLDELPQLINVLKGEMSVVGPRPHAIRTSAGGRQCDEIVDQYAVRHKVKPGITGWAQVNGWRGTMEDEEQLIRRVEHDLHYINNWSPMLDVKIIARTGWVVLAGRNSY